MVKTWLLRSVVFFALICVSSLLSYSTVNGANERYSWQSYNAIEVYAGAFDQLKTSEGGAAVTTFVQDEPNSRTFVAQDIGPECAGPILLTLTQNPTRADLAVDGDCDGLKNYDTSVVINTLGSAISSVESEAREIIILHKDKECPASPDQESCFTAAATTAAKEQVRCSREHDYKQDVVVANAYLDCLASALGVERPTATEDEEQEDPKQSCQIPSIGWIACQLTEFIAQLADHTFQLLKPFLELDPLTKDIGANPNNSSTAYKAWQTLRDIANVSLVIGFFFVIYSYLTGLGINTYTIKRSLPRLVVCAVLINISFFLCGALIDISNITGRSLQALTTDFSDVTPSQSDVYKDWSSVTKRVNSITPTDEEFTNESTANMSQQERERLGLPAPDPAQANPDPAGQTATSNSSEDPPKATAMIVNGTAIFGGLVLYANLAVLVPLMVIALFSMFVTLLILLFRHALIIVLVIVSPLAMAAYILPGTKQWFDKWKSTFVQLLLLYPIIAIIFSGSVIASNVIMESAQNNGQTLLAIFSMGILVIPLMVTPLLLKFGGGILSQFGGTIQNAISKPRGAALKAANNFRKDRKTLAKTRGINGKFLFGKIDGNKNKVVRNVNKVRSVGSAIKEGRARREEKINRDFAAYTATNFERLAGAVRDPEIISGAQAIEAANLKEVRLKDVTAMEARFEEDASISSSDALAMAKTGKWGGAELNEVERQAAIRIAMKNATLKEAHELIEVSDTMDAGMREELVNGITANKLTAGAPHLGAGALRRIKDGIPGSNNVNKMVADGANANAFSGARLAQSDSDTLRRLNAVIEAGEVDSARAQSIKAAAEAELSGSHSGEIRHVNELRRLAGRP